MLSPNDEAEGDDIIENSHDEKVAPDLGIARPGDADEHDGEPQGHGTKADAGENDGQGRQLANGDGEEEKLGEIE